MLDDGYKSSLGGGLTIIRGSDKQFTVRITIQDPCNAGIPGPPFDLTGVTEIKAYFPPQPPTTTPVTLTMTGGQITVLNVSQGSMQMVMNDTTTPLLLVGDSQNFEIEIHIGSVISIVQFMGVLTVVDRLFGPQ
jgi:hypothetical protein